VLFNSYEFLFVFLPVTLAVHQWVIRRWGGRAAMGWLAAMSLVFYGWWYPPYLLLLLASTAGNYVFGRWVSAEQRSPESRLRLLKLGVALNLFFLGFYKYTGFLDHSIETLIGYDLMLPQYALPLGISFFTFTQIAYLVDAYRGLTRAHDSLDYVLFVTFFPHLIAGPIVHHGEMLPQFHAARKPTSVDRAVGFTMLAIGMAKKVLIADWMAGHADKYFGMIHSGHTPTMVGAWTGVLAYHFQIYFDFSGYSDMAVGLARMFGIVFPLNFDAPYRANNMIDFWRRWHVTLGRFLRDYLYIALGGSRNGTFWRYANLFITMVLGGLWHGAGWGFVAWGAANGLFLLINHGWRKLRGGEGQGRAAVISGRILTTLAWMIGFIFFRSITIGDAGVMFRTMVGLSHTGIGVMEQNLPLAFLAAFALTQLAPTSQRWLEKYQSVLVQGTDRLHWRPSLTWSPTQIWAVILGLLFFACIPVIERASPFIYWAF
jgi:D-alanyl-lipoteichoic acid acyltransferase DltB (MBOAT superfamily)